MAKAMVASPALIVCAERSTRQEVGFARAQAGEQRLGRRLLDARRQQPVLDGVGGEDIAEARRDHRAEAEVGERVDRRLARGARAEIAARDENLRATTGLGVEGKIRIERAVGAGA